MFYGRQIGSQNGVVKGANCLSAGLACISHETRNAQEDVLTNRLTCFKRKVMPKHLLMSVDIYWCAVNEPKS